MISKNRQKRLIACLLCAVLLISSLSMTVGAVTEQLAVKDSALTRFDWGVLDPAFGKNALAQNMQGERVSEGFTMSYKELADALSCSDASAQVYVTDASGRGQGNPDATVNRNGGITFRKSGTAGESVFYYVLKSAARVYGPMAVKVYTYGVSDSIFVLDYNLPVSMPMSQIMQGDLLALTPKTTYSVSVARGDTEGEYGTFTSGGASITYTMKDFMKDADTMKIKVTVHQSGKAFEENVTGVTMTKTLKVVPASVVYYEDDFEGLHYIDVISTIALAACYSDEHPSSKRQTAETWKKTAKLLRTRSASLKSAGKNSCRKPTKTPEISLPKPKRKMRNWQRLWKTILISAGCGNMPWFWKG